MRQLIIDIGGRNMDPIFAFCAALSIGIGIFVGVNGYLGFMAFMLAIGAQGFFMAVRSK